MGLRYLAHTITLKGEEAVLVVINIHCGPEGQNIVETKMSLPFSYLVL